MTVLLDELTEDDLSKLRLSASCDGNHPLPASALRRLLLERDRFIRTVQHQRVMIEQLKGNLPAELPFLVGKSEFQNKVAQKTADFVSSVLKMVQDEMEGFSDPMDE